MGSEVISAFFKEKSPAFFSVVLICTFILLFGPERMRHTLGLQSFVDENRTLIGVGLLFSFAYILVFLSAACFKKVSRIFKIRSSRKENEKKRDRYMENLTRDEVLYILPYLTGINTLHFRIEDGVRGGLEAKEIIYRASSVGSILDGWAYNIQPWAIEYLQSYPGIYEKHVGKLAGEEDFKSLYSAGVPWVRNPWNF